MNAYGRHGFQFIPCFHETVLKEALINSTNEMKCKAHGTQQPRHINLIGEAVSTAQRSNSLVQSINQRFLKGNAENF